jgi:multidrug efflux pump subunit AcrA (membrane-fusion protein)
MTTVRASPQYAIRKLNLVGCTAIVAAVGGVGGWASTTDIAGAVIASGTVVVETSVKKVQHLTGGIVGDILVKDGSEVETGQVVMRLDDTLTRANLGVVQSQLDLYVAREARLLAERDGLEVALPKRRGVAQREKPSRAPLQKKNGYSGRDARDARVNARSCANGSLRSARKSAA